MIRVALVEWAEDDWRIFRQEQWMAEVRRNPPASRLPRVHLDIDEAAYRTVVEAWDRDTHGRSRGSALGRLIGSGAVEIAPRP